MLERNDLELIRDVIREEFQGESFRNAVREEVGDILEQVVLPRFEEINDRFDGIDSRLDGIDSRLDGHDSHFDRIETRLNRIEAEMVTKDFLDEKLALFKVGLENSAVWVAQQVTRLTQVLHKNGVLTAEQVVNIRTG